MLEEHPTGFAGIVTARVGDPGEIVLDGPDSKDPCHLMVRAEQITMHETARLPCLEKLLGKWLPKGFGRFRLP